MLLAPQGVRGIEHGASEGMHADGKQAGRHEDDELSRQQADDIACRGAHHLANADLPRAARRIQRHESVDAETGDQQGESRRVAEDACQILLILIEPGDIVLQVGELEGGFGHGFSPRVP